LKPEEPRFRYDDSQLLQPSQITGDDYLYYVGKYNVQDVNPPPPQFIKVTRSFHRETPNKVDFALSDDDSKIPKGYGALSIEIVGDTIHAGHVSLDVGNIRNLFSLGHVRTINGLGMQGSVPVSISGYGITGFNLNIIIQCELVKEYFEKWQLETYTAILNAYQKALLNYEERVAAAQIASGGCDRGRKSCHQS
jgi:hypothetical protein